MTSFNIGSQEFSSKQIIDMTHPPIIRILKVKTGQGVLNKGMLVAFDANDGIVPYGQIETQLGTGDGSTTQFTGTFAQKPLTRGSVTVTAGSLTLTDDGNGNLNGDGDGSVNYTTGEINANFASAPSADTPVLARGVNKVIGVLTEDCDTAIEETAKILRHGTVVKANIYVKDAQITDFDLSALEDIGIFAI